MQEEARANQKTKGGNAVRGIVKWMLHNPYLRHPALAIAFGLGFRGINRVQSAHFKYLRDWHGEKLRRREVLLDVDVEAQEGELGAKLVTLSRWRECPADTDCEAGVLEKYDTYVKTIKRVFEKPRLSYNYNSRVNVGADLAAYLLSGSNLGSLTSPGVPDQIALSTSTLTPAATDTTLAGETSVSGLARTAGTIQNYVAPTALDGGASFDVYHSFTLATGASATTVVSTALFDAGGNLFAEVNLSNSAGMSPGDIIQLTWTVNF